jgi:hypothetical protein
MPTTKPVAAALCLIAALTACGTGAGSDPNPRLTLVVAGGHRWLSCWTWFSVRGQRDVPAACRGRFAGVGFEGRGRSAVVSQDAVGRARSLVRISGSRW